MTIVMGVGLVIGSLIGAPILKPMAKHIGKVPNAKFGNSFLVCLAASTINMTTWYFLGEESILKIMEWSFFGVFILNLVFTSLLFIIAGKLIWNCSWMQSLKSNIVWIILYASMIGYGLMKLNESMGQFS